MNTCSAKYYTDFVHIHQFPYSFLQFSISATLWISLDIRSVFKFKVLLLIGSYTNS